MPAAVRPYARSPPRRERPAAAALAALLAKIRATELAQKHLGLAGIRLNLLAGAARDDDTPASSLAHLLAALAARPACRAAAKSTRQP